MGGLGYAVRVKRGLRFEAPRDDGTIVGWTVKRAIGGGSWTAQPDGDEKARVPFHESEITCRIEATDERAGSYMHPRAIATLAWIASLPLGQVLHVKIPSGLPPWARTIFLRGVITETAGRRLFQPTGVIAKPEQFEMAMTLPWFAKRVREQLQVGMIPPMFECYEAELADPAYDPTGMEPISPDRVGGDPETENLERICALAARTLRRKSTVKKRLTPIEAIRLAHSILAQGLKKAA